MRVLITGANGYIGKSLYNALKEEHEVSGINRQVVDLIDPIAVKHYFDRADYFDVVIHCAVAGGSRLTQDDWNVMDKNLTMYYNLLANRSCFGRFIHFGSGAETYMPKEPYGYSKKVIAKSILNQDNFYNLKIFGVFDENELDTRFIKANIKRYINKEPIQVHRDKIMDLFYMEDLIRVVKYYVTEETPPKEFDCVYENVNSLRGVAELINELDNYKVDIQIANEGLDLYKSNYAAPLPIGLVGLKEGIKRTYNKLKNESN